MILAYLERLAALIPHRPLGVLDVATASADIPAAIARWARGRGLAVRLAALDIHPEILAEARQATRDLPEIALVRGDALRLPMGAHSVDVVISALALHHFTFDAAARLLREIDRVARGGFVVNDVIRSWPAYVGAVADTWLLGGGRLARHDGPLSVRRSFTWEEYHDLVRAAGIERVEVRRHRFQRVVLVRWPGRGEARA